MKKVNTKDTFTHYRKIYPKVEDVTKEFLEN